jgi:D-glycerate 3-kinase
VGVNGSIGQGKSFFSREIVSRLNPLLTAYEGQAITRSIDDYYLSKAERSTPQFIARGYNPQGISNRGPAGTHDVERLNHDITALEESRNGSVVDLPSFDKRTDDRSLEPYRIAGKVGVFILEGWFVGDETDVDAMKAPVGLKRSVALALKTYQPIFRRLDALWAFNPPGSLEVIISQRVEQEETLRQKTEEVGMTPAQIRRFVEYFYKDSWQEGVSSPFPSKESVSFWAVTDIHHRFVRIESATKS